VLGAANAAAASWTVRPEITLRETYTDNAFIGSGTPRSDWVTQVTPGIRIDGRGPRLTANLSYFPSAVFYARNSEGNDVINNLDAFGRLEAVEKFFFVEAGANISQSFISPFAPQPGDIAIASQNRIETRTLTFSPYIRHEGRDLEYELRSRNTWTNSDSTGLGKFRTEQWTGRVGSPVRRFGWSLEFDNSDISHYDGFIDRPEDKSRLYRARLYYQPNPELRLFVSAGSEENNYVLQQMQRSDIYGAGLGWKPSARTSLDLEYEERFFGPSRLARFAHRTRLTAWSVGYSRNTSTYQQEVLRLPPGNATAMLDSIFAARISDPDERRAAVEQFMTTSGTPAFLANSLAFYTQRVYLREGVDASFALVGKRNSITFTAFAAESTDLPADALGLPSDALLLARRIKQRGYGAYAQHRLTPLTSIGASATRTYSREDQPVETDSRNDNYNLALTHTVSPKTTTFAGVAVTRFDSEESGFIPNQDATSVFVGLNHRF
jgi:uncharacterized protein (PEP-CTERM system associated)